MRKILLMIVLLMVIVTPVHALEIEAPMVPESGSRFMPPEPDNLWQAAVEMIRDAIYYFRPTLKDAVRICVGVIGAAMIMSLVRNLPGASSRTVNLAGTLAVCMLLFSHANAMVTVSSDTVRDVTEYGKLLLPVMTAALAAQGGISSSSALYACTAFFGNLLSSLITRLLIPIVYLFLVLAAAKCAAGDEMLKNLSNQIKGCLTWILKTLLYLYTGFITVTGVITGTTDASALKAAKLTISGAVPVVGGILSDASEALLVSAGTLKNAAGLYGMLAILAVWIGPFIQIGVQYLVLKCTGTICGTFSCKEITDLIGDFSSAMGLLLAMTGTVCLTLLIGVACFMRGVM